MLKSKKLFMSVLLVVFALSLAAGAVALAQGDPATDGGSVRDRVSQMQNKEVLAAEVDKICAGIVGFVRGIFTALAVVFVFWIGFALWGTGGDPARIAMAKRSAAGFIICVICVYSAEKIVGGLLGLLGYQVH